MDNEGKMKLAYLILAHTDVTQLNRLINSIDSGDDIFIHVDLKTDDKYLKKIYKSNNIHLIKKRYSIFWAGFNMVEATLALIHEMISTNVDYDKVVLLSGADCLIKNSEYIHNFFNNRINYIRAFNISDYTTLNYRDQITKYHYNDSKHFSPNSNVYKFSRRIFNKLMNSRLFPRTPDTVELFDKKVPVYEGSQWWALNRDFLEYVDKLMSSKEGQRFKKYFLYYLAPDEKFFHTIFFNSKFYDTNLYGGPEDFPWQVFQKYKGTLIEGAATTAQMYNVHIIHSSLHKTFTKYDLPYLNDKLNNKSNLFMRKVDTNESKELLDIIEKNKISMGKYK